jgi:hypothetical protein
MFTSSKFDNTPDVTKGNNMGFRSTHETSWEHSHLLCAQKSTFNVVSCEVSMAIKKMAAWSSEWLIFYYITTWCHNAGDEDSMVL